MSPPTEPIACPLCTSAFSVLKQTLGVDRVLRRWTEFLGLDVSDEFHGISQLDLRECKDCKLQFFHPNSLAGSPALYGKLEKFHWYYMPRKWEHDVALRDLAGCKNGVELGCGFGDFVARVIQETDISFEGSEQSPTAVELASRKGIPVHLRTAEELAQSRPGAYSAVCSFQVLEHLSRPADFLHASCNLLQPGGKLMLGVPNAESFLRHEFNPLDMPPHHMTRWTADVLSRLPHRFPLRLERIAYEPLATYHVAGYVEAYTGLLASRGVRVLTLPRIRSLIARLIRVSRIRKVLRGHTIYACYARI
jgi:SAM-dependent methyltransferase